MIFKNARVLARFRRSCHIFMIRLAHVLLMLSAFACVYVVLYLLSFSASNNLCFINPWRACAERVTVVVSYVCVSVCMSRPVARGGSGGSIEPPISGSVYCAVQSVHSMPHGFGRRQSSRIHNIEQCSAARLAAPRLHKRARRSERADVYNNNN